MECSDGIRAITDGCHPACACREAKVEELVEAAGTVVARNIAASSHWDGCEKLHPYCRLKAAIEGVTS